MKQPNILFITSDQHRGDALGCAGHPVIRTPHLDALSYAGIRFENAYSNCPICIPARTTIITGRDAHQNGCPEQAPGHLIDREKEAFLGSLMTQAGYQTQLIGKTHWHTPDSFRAGFENVIGLNRLKKERLLTMNRPTRLTGMGGNEMSPTMSQFPPHLNSTDWIVDRSLEFLEYRDRTVPFFLWASFTEPHPPNVIHEPYYSMYDQEDIPEPVLPEWARDEHSPYAIYTHKWHYNPGPMGKGELRKARRVYYGAITHLDHQLGRLFGTLMAEGLWDDTLVVYTTDHGEKLGDFGDFAKSSFTENAAQIPFIAKWPSWIKAEPGRISEALVELADLLPTFCDAAGIRPPEDVTGHSLLPIVAGDRDNVRADLHGQIQDSHMFHDGRYKYLYFAEDGKELLFDVTTDRKDEIDLSHDRELLSTMRKKFVAHLHEEGHDHLIDGKLLNKRLEKPPVNVLRAKRIATCRGAAR